MRAFLWKGSALIQLISFPLSARSMVPELRSWNLEGAAFSIRWPAWPALRDGRFVSASRCGCPFNSVPFVSARVVRTARPIRFVSLICLMALTLTGCQASRLQASRDFAAVEQAGSVERESLEVSAARLESAWQEAAQARRAFLTHGITQEELNAAEAQVLSAMDLHAAARIRRNPSSDRVLCPRASSVSTGGTGHTERRGKTP